MTSDREGKAVSGHRRWVPLAILVTFVLVHPAGAAPLVRPDPSAAETRLDPDVLEWLPDRDRRWTFDEVAGDPRSGRFGTRREVPLGSTGVGLWARFRLRVDDSEPWFLVVPYVPLERLCVHWPRSRGYEPICTGAAQAFSTRPVRHHQFVFPVPEDLSSAAPVYVYAESDLAPVDIPMELTPARAFEERARVEELRRGLYFGSLLALAAYNLFLFLSARDRAFLYYTFHVAFMGLGLFGLDGHLAEYFFPDWPALRASPILLMSLAFVFGLLYVRQFLDTRMHAPRCDLALRLVAAVAGLVFVVYFVDAGLANRVALLTLMLFSVVVPVVTILRLRAGYRPARFLLLAFAVFLLTSPVVALTNLGVLPRSVSTGNWNRYGVVAAAFLLSFGLADRLRQLSAERQAAILELRQRNAELSRFVYTVSHDLKTPLVTIKGFLGFLERDAKAGDDAKLEQDVRRIVTATDQMSRLLEEILRYSRAGRSPSQKQRVPVTELVAEAVARVENTAAERGVAMAMAPELPVVSCERAPLVEVYRILLDNAVAYMGDQSDPRIEIGARRDGEEKVLYVRDNGMGIEPRYHEKVFDLFERLEPAGEGTGAGLALARRIVELHGGRLWVESDGVGRGSTFCFTLPQT